MKILSWRKDRCFSRVSKATVVTSGCRVKRVLSQVKTLSWRKDTLVEEGLQIERGTVFLRDTCHREIYQRNSRDKRLPREACLDLGDVKVVKEGGPLFERGMVFLRDTCHCVFFFTETFLTSDCRVKGALTRAMSKWTKHIVTFNEEEDEDTLVDEGPQIERGTVFLRDTCQREIHQRNIRDKRFPREACFDLGDVKVDETHCDLQ